MDHLLQKPPISLQLLSPPMVHLLGLLITHLPQDHHTTLLSMELHQNDPHMLLQPSPLPQRGLPILHQYLGAGVPPVLVQIPSMVNLSHHRFSTANSLSIVAGPMSNRQVVVLDVDLQPKGLLGIAPATAT